jgi:hypothetical protein
MWDAADLALKPFAGRQIYRGVRTSVARISYYAALATAAHAAFSQRRRSLLNATNLDRKSGIRGPKTMAEPTTAFRSGPYICDTRNRFEGEACGIPHLAKNERDVGHPAIDAGIEHHLAWTLVTKTRSAKHYRSLSLDL